MSALFVTSHPELSEPPRHTEFYMKLNRNDLSAKRVMIHVLA